MSQKSGDSIIEVIVVILVLALIAGGYFFFYKSTPAPVGTAASIRTDLFWKGGNIDLGGDGSLPESIVRDLGISDEQHKRFEQVVSSYVTKLQEMKEEYSQYSLEGTDTLLVEIEPFPEEGHTIAMKLKQELLDIFDAQQVDHLDQNMPCAERFAYWGAYRYKIRFRPEKDKDWCYIEHSRVDPHGGSSSSGKGEETITGKLENQLYNRILKKLLEDKPK